MKLQIKEGIKQVDNGIYITDYVGDVVNLLMNKPKPYRLVWNKIDDVYGIGDAYKYIHVNIEDVMIKQGYGNEDLYKSPNIDKTYSEFTFVSYDNVDNSWEVGGFVGQRDSATYIPSGIILTYEGLQQAAPDLYNKLKRNKLLSMDITKIEKVLTNYTKELQRLRNEEKEIIQQFNKEGFETQSQYIGIPNFEYYINLLNSDSSNVWDVYGEPMLLMNTTDIFNYPKTDPERFEFLCALDNVGDGRLTYILNNNLAMQIDRYRRVKNLLDTNHIPYEYAYNYI